MLVYARVGSKSASPMPGNPNGDAATSQSPKVDVEPPPKAMEVVQAMNAAHEKACEDYVQRYAPAHNPWQSSSLTGNM